MLWLHWLKSRQALMPEICLAQQGFANPIPVAFWYRVAGTWKSLAVPVCFGRSENHQTCRKFESRGILALPKQWIFHLHDYIQKPSLSGYFNWNFQLELAWSTFSVRFMPKIKGQTLFSQTRSCIHLFVAKDFAATLDKRQNSIFADFSFEQDLCVLSSWVLVLCAKYSIFV